VDRRHLWFCPELHDTPGKAKNVIRRVGKLTLYEPGGDQPMFPHHWLKQSTCCQSKLRLA
jgi:hypothetical protein